MTRREESPDQFARVAWEHPARLRLAAADGHKMKMKCSVGDPKGGRASATAQARGGLLRPVPHNRELF